MLSIKKVFMTHTPGPWTQTAYDKGFNIFSEVHGGIAFIPTTRKAHYNEHEANAKLIAAAPDLLEALQAVVQKLDMSGNMSVAAKEYYSEVVNKAQSAIKKATSIENEIQLPKL